MCQIETKMATSFIIILFPVFVQNDAAQLGNNAIKMQLKMSKYFIFVWGIMIVILISIFFFFFKHERRNVTIFRRSLYMYIWTFFFEGLDCHAVMMDEIFTRRGNSIINMRREEKKWQLIIQNGERMTRTEKEGILIWNLQKQKNVLFIMLIKGCD